MPSTPPFDDTIVRQLAKILNETDLTEIEYELNDCKIRVVRTRASVSPMHVAVPTAPALSSTPAATLVTPTAPASPVDNSKHPGAIKAPMVGTVYRAPSPGAPAFVEVGSAVKKDQTLCVIEAMKVMNQIRASKDGVVTAIFCRDADPIEYDQVLMIIE
jgi:acetyl-CoA carboxylase biotin carboxyl carrier protein